MRLAVALTVPCAIALGGVSHAQEHLPPLLLVRGTVTDTVLGPISGAIVSLATAGTYTVTDTAGQFVLTGIVAGLDTLHVRARGFTPRSFHMVLSDSFDIGTVVLRPGPPPVLTLRVSVREVTLNEPVADAEVVLNERVVGTTDMSGVLSVTAMPADWGINSVLVRRIGYAPLLAIQWVDAVDTRWTVNGVLQKQTVDLPAIVVEADRVVFAYGRMRDFWLRRERGWGRYITRADIERRRPARVSDMLTTVPGLQVWRFGGTTRVTTRGRCEPTIWVDGFPESERDLDSFVRPGWVAGIEIYTQSPSTPPEFARPGSGECGAIVIWTR